MSYAFAYSLVISWARAFGETLGGSPGAGLELEPADEEEEEGRTLVLGNLWSFFHFILRFWNQILICRSDSNSEWAISIRLRRVR